MTAHDLAVGENAEIRAVLIPLASESTIVGGHRPPLQLPVGIRGTLIEFPYLT